MSTVKMEDMIMASKHTYWISISIDNGRTWGPKVGWDDDFATREDAESCAARARKLEGWSAKVIESAEEEEA